MEPIYPGDFQPRLSAVAHAAHNDTAIIPVARGRLRAGHLSHTPGYLLSWEHLEHIAGDYNPDNVVRLPLRTARRAASDLVVGPVERGSIVQIYSRDWTVAVVPRSWLEDRVPASDLPAFPGE